jgi:hypothetical protein
MRRVEWNLGYENAVPVLFHDNRGMVPGIGIGAGLVPRTYQPGGFHRISTIGVVDKLYLLASLVLKCLLCIFLY